MPKLRRRALFLIGGVLVGLAAILMAYLAQTASAGFFAVERRLPLLPLVLTPAAFAGLAWLTRRFAPGAQGSGLPQVIAARQIDEFVDKAHLVSPRVAIGKVLLLNLGLAFGASTGREGPTAQVGAAIMLWLGRFAPHRQPGLLLAGAAAGVAAAFNAPLAGIVFGIEEMSRSFELRTSGLVLGTVIAAGMTSLALVGNYTYFGRSDIGMAFDGNLLWIPVVGVICGIFGGLFSAAIIAANRGLPGRLGRLIKAHPIAFAAGCGLLVAICGVASGGVVFGTSSEQATQILNGEQVTAWFAPLKFIATIATSVSGIPGGIFAPALSIGAGIASVLDPFTGMPVSALTIICMAAYLAAVLQAPITAFVIVTEMTGNQALILPAMLACFIASVVSKLICPEGIYHALAHQLLRKQPLAA
ncbi:MAG: chloride channel protein [Devosia sp.]